jgi:hypothetical protein
LNTLPVGDPPPAVSNAVPITAAATTTPAMSSVKDLVLRTIRVSCSDLRNVDYAGLDGPGAVVGAAVDGVALGHHIGFVGEHGGQCSLSVSVSAFSAVKSKPGPIPMRAAPVAVIDVIVTDSNERTALSDPHLHSN